MLTYLTTHAILAVILVMTLRARGIRGDKKTKDKAITELLFLEVTRWHKTKRLLSFMTVL